MQAKKLEQNDYSFPVKLFLSLVLLALVPFFYQVIRTYLVANIPNVCGLNIACHIEWFDLIDETLRAFLIMPLYAIFNKVYSDKKRLKERIAGIAFISFIIYTLFSIIVLIWCSNIVSHMGAEENIPETTAYLRLETVGFIIGLVSSFASVLFVIIGKTKYVYALLLARTVATIAGDLFLIPKFGVNGIAFSNIAVNTLAAIVCIVMLKADYVVIPFYITYAISQVISSIFIGYGKTWCNLIISLCVNLVYYPIVYCMVLRGIFTPSIIFICFMFGAGMALNMLISIGLFIKIKKNL